MSKKKVVDSTLCRTLVGGLMYLTTTKIGSTYLVNMFGHFMETPKYAHWESDKRILRYVKGAQNHGL